MVNMGSESEENSFRFVGCCGAYCKTCKQFIEDLAKAVN